MQKIISWNKHGWGAGAGCFWLLLAGAEKKEPEPLGKISGAGALKN